MKTSPLDIPFLPQSTSEWKARVEKELKGKSYAEFLEWDSSEGFQIEAWQDASDHQKISLPPLRNPWKILHPVYEEEAKDASKEALNALMNGAEAIWINKGFKGAAALLATKDIDQSIAPVFIRSVNINDVFKPLLKSGTDIAVEMPEGNVLINGLRMRERGASVIEEIALSVSQGIALLNSGTSPEDIHISTGLGTSYLTEIAKTRALRLLWSGVLRTLRLPVSNPTLIGINLRIDYSNSNEYSNILRATSSAQSGVIGGVTYMMIEPWNRGWQSDYNFSSRISRNIQNLLREEGRLDKNLNPSDGSYFIDNLTSNIAHQAWSIVQNIEAEGGFESFTKSGNLKALLEKSRYKLIENFQSGEKVVLGVNKYPPANPVKIVVPNRSSYLHLPDHVHLPSQTDIS